MVLVVTCVIGQLHYLVSGQQVCNEPNTIYTDTLNNNMCHTHLIANW